MKKIKITFILGLLIVLNLNVFGQTPTKPFEVTKSGQGDQSLIFIPGFASSGEVWAETLPRYENDYTCYTLTMAGFAGAEPQSSPSFNEWIDSIADFITENKIEKPVIIGHSMGGVLALAIASDYPDLVKSIVVVDALPCLSALMNPGFKTVEEPDCTPIIDSITAMTEEEFEQMQKISLSQLTADTTKIKTLTDWSLKSDRYTFAKIYCEFSNTDLRDKIKSIKVPALILLESNFKNIKQIVETQYKNLHTACFEYADKGLHFIMYDDKDWYFGQLDNFLIGKAE